jgi:hypothetical protein
MEIDGKVITVNGVDYVPTSEALRGELNDADYVLVRTRSAGVFAGNLLNRYGQEVTLQNARRIWFWDGAASLSQLAVDGTSKPHRCKFPCPVREIILSEVIEVMPCTKKAMDSIRGVPEWKM